ncbi:E3 ubiquitin-protein ligase rnf19a [Bulinus truncatus]|nr:E3 ubiquitin-protein ligase rnf19a [Bulinus truncatus]
MADRDLRERKINSKQIDENNKFQNEESSIQKDSSNTKHSKKKTAAKEKITTKPGILSYFTGKIKYIFLIIFVPPFLNYASLQREGVELKPEGELYDIGWGQKLFLSCHGKGPPTVVFDAPTGMSSDVWTLVAAKLAEHANVCVYDRAGLGFSDRPVNRTSSASDQDSQPNFNNFMKWNAFTVERMVDDLHKLITTSSQQPRPLIFVGAELGAVVSQFYAHLFESDVIGMVLVNPLSEDLFQQSETVWLQHWFGSLGPTYQTLQLGAALGITRLGLLLGVLKQPITGDQVPERVTLRQKYLLCHPRHLSSVVDEHHFINETFSQMRTLKKIKSLASNISISVLTGNYYDEQMQGHLNKAWARAEQSLLSKFPPTVQHSVINGADRHMMYRKPEPIIEAVLKIIRKWRRTRLVDNRSRTSTFSLSRLLPRRRSKSRLSLESEPSRSDSGTCSNQISSLHSSSHGVNSSSPSPPLTESRQTILSSDQLHRSTKNHGESYLYSEGSHNVLLGDGQSEMPGRGVIPPHGDEAQSVPMECPVCLVEKNKDLFFEFSTCHHRCCSNCLREYFRIEIMESRLTIACPECSELFHPNEIRAVVQDEVLMQKYEDFMLRRVLAMDSDARWCPAPDCGYAVIATGCAGCPKLKCERPGCDTFFCYHCKQYWHPNQTCDAARAERSPNMRSASISYSQESGAQNEIKSCPRCGAFIIKMDDGSCNHMTCAVCGAGFCWLCMKEISDLHYLSPSGCTFWGRKPWSRKKKILWQLGTLVGAPIGITLVAGIAVPAMIIGIPVWVGRKIHYRFDGASKHRRNLAITGGVTASILAAPIIAGLAVGIGVPILLAYVYGVVPFSLCRSGGCGVTTTNSGGVRFEFDEHDENNTHGPYSYTGDTHSMETAPNVANPSIAPSIGDTSLGMTNSLSASGSHIDRAGILRDDSDRDSASHRVLVGNSINGSLCSASYSTQHHKLEVHADISEHSVLCERSSMGGESYSMSLNDDASTRALAGSIVSPKDKDGISLCSRHFDGTPVPQAYPEEDGSKDEMCRMSSDGGQHQRGSSSCPTSPHLRKASPAPSEDTRSTRGKKCTRFMDQVSEIETKSDCLSIGSIISTSSSSPCYDSISPTLPAYSTLSLTASSCAPVQASLASCESLMSEGKAEMVGAPDLGENMKGVRLKAESTSVLMDGAESRFCEMGGARRKSDSTSKDDFGHTERSFSCRKKKSGAGCEKEHRSQPGTLSDISEVRGMPTMLTSGCPDLLAVIDANCENVFLDKKGQTKSRRISLSSSCSSSFDDPLECPSKKYMFLERGHCKTCETREKGVFENISGSHLNVAYENMSNNDLEGEEITSLSAICIHGKQIALDHDGLSRTVGLSEGDEHSRCPVKLTKRDSCLSRTSIGSDTGLAASPLPDVEIPNSFIEIAGAAVPLTADEEVLNNVTPFCAASSESVYTPGTPLYSPQKLSIRSLNTAETTDHMTIPSMFFSSEPMMDKSLPSNLPLKGTKELSCSTIST